MLRIAFDVELGHVSEPVRSAVSDWGLSTQDWAHHEDDVVSMSDAIVTVAARVPSVHAAYASRPAVPPIVVHSVEAPPSETRQLVRQGVAALLDLSIRPIAQAQAVVAAATGFLVLPVDHGLEMATRLAAPPRPLTAFEEDFLRLAATRSVEAAGAKLGYSRRQAQRKFRSLMEELDLSSHLEASAAAGRWGLLE